VVLGIGRISLARKRRLIQIAGSQGRPKAPTATQNASLKSWGQK